MRREVVGIDSVADVITAAQANQAERGTDPAVAGSVSVIGQLACVPRPCRDATCSEEHAPMPLAAGEAATPADAAIRQVSA